MKAIFFNEPAEEYFLGHQFAEVYKEQVYAPFLVGRKDMTIVDIGANIGVTAFYLSHYAEKLVAVEPSKEHFELLSKMVEFNELKQIIPVNKAIYIKPGKFPLFHPKLGNKTMYTLHTALGMEESEEVEAITIEELFKSQGLTHVDMLKMDIEGTEVEVFSSDTFRKVADKIDLITIESHAWTGRHPNQLKEALKNAGFKVEGIENEASLYVARRI